MTTDRTSQGWASTSWAYRPTSQTRTSRSTRSSLWGSRCLSDPDHAVAEAWSTWGEKVNYGKTYMGIIRSSFLVDEDGKIERAWYKVKPEKTVPNATEALAS